jgi:enterochelin esterase-like enzyme
VTFIRRGSSTVQSIFLDGGLPGHPADKQLTRLGDTDLWYRSERLPADARFSYGFGVLSGSATQPSYVGDPLNPRGGQVELPAAPPLPWLQPMPDVPAGKLSNQRLASPILNGATRTFTVFTPAGYDPDGNPYSLLVLFDGEVYRDRTLIAGTIALDNLIARGRIQPLVAVLINTGNSTRDRDLGNSPAFADFLAEELVPWVRQNYRVSTDPSRTIVGGLSLGGLMAAYCGLRHSNVFGNVLSQSGAFFVWDGWPKPGTQPIAPETGWLTRRFATTQQLPLRFFLEVGTLEKWAESDFLTENRRLRDVLEAKGYAVSYREMNGSHDILNWRSTLADGLIALAAPPRPQ